MKPGKPFLTKPAGCFVQLVGGVFMVLGVLIWAAPEGANGAAGVTFMLGAGLMVLGGVSARRHMRINYGRKD
ncbi:MAG: hypothetical protein P8Y66_12145 [Nitrospirota bacterium]